MPKRRGLRKGGRRTQMDQFLLRAAQGAVAAHGVAKAGEALGIPGLSSKKKGRGPDKIPGGRRKNLRGPPQAMLRANSEGYIPAYSKVIGNSKKGLSFTEKIQKIINPPQTILTNTTAKYEASSGRQSINVFNFKNVDLTNFFSLTKALRSDGTSQTPYVDDTSPTAQVNHLWTSVQHTFMNSGNLTAELEVYIFKSAQDIDGLDAPRDAKLAWDYAESINSAPGIGADNNTHVGKKPTDASVKFYVNRFWKLIGTCAVQLKPGESFKHYFRHHYNKPLMQYMLHGDGAACVKDHCLSFVFVVKGQVVGSSVDSTISTGDAQISVVRSVKYSAAQGQNVRPRDLLIGTDLGVIATANQIFINTDTSSQTTGFVEDA
jgi:hypothetical protein